jgi:stearoyl-CoA desaturase (delta-9 desaturase)
MQREIACGKTKFLPAGSAFLLPRRSKWAPGQAFGRFFVTHVLETNEVVSLSINIEPVHDDIMYPDLVPFLAVHAGCVAAIWSGVTWQAIAICGVLYWLRMFAITGGYHRYFSHRAYSTGRVFQFLLAFLAQSTAQKSVLWWAAKHRHHHLHSDTEQDAHSPRHNGFVYSHVGWIFDRRHDATDLVKVSDFASYLELMWLHKLELLPAIVLGAFCVLIAGWSGLVVGFLWSTVLLITLHSASIPSHTFAAASGM